MKGRKPKATVLKLLSGNPGGRRLNAAEPQPEGDLSAAPSWMTAGQREIWRYAIDNAPAGLLRLLDRDLFTSWVVAVDEINLAEAELRVSGPVVKQGGSERTTTHPDGSKVTTIRSDSWVVSPWAKARDHAFQRMMKATSELGFSPTSRSRITLAGGGKKEANRFSNNAAKRA